MTTHELIATSSPSSELSQVYWRSSTFQSEEKTIETTSFPSLVKNKILYRRKCYIDIQRHIRMFLVYKRFAPRIRGLVKSKALHEQIKAMEQLILPMKINKDQIQKQIEELRQRINQLIDNITVRTIIKKDKSSSSYFAFRTHR